MCVCVFIAYLVMLMYMSECEFLSHSVSELMVFIQVVGLLLLYMCLCASSCGMDWRSRWDEIYMARQMRQM